MARRIACTLLYLTTHIVSVLSVNPGCASAEPAIRFNRDVRPLLSARCFQCHGPDKNNREADLRLDLREAAIDSVIVPGKADESELIARLITEDPDERMPPVDSHKDPLTTEEVAILRRWIDEGANYEPHWSFVAPQRPDLPDVGDSWSDATPLDRFVLARAKEEGFVPAPLADRQTLIRRLSFDLTGLPPTPSEVDAFASDTSPTAYEKVVDRLLQSKRYGEHRARHWLDAARYADTNGYQYDLERSQWVWRDWVIHAFNTNMPFDQFTIEQMAGDLLPGATDQQKLATGFHRNHPVTIEGGVIDEEYRTEYVIDRVVTTSTVWLGMTMLCSRCHDHKYDPVSQQEFYQLFAFFNQVPERGLRGFDPRMKVASPLAEGSVSNLDDEVAAAKKRFDALLAQADGSIAEWEKDLRAQTDSVFAPYTIEQMKSLGGAELVQLDDGSVLAGGKNPGADTYEISLRIAASQVHAVRLEALTHPSLTRGSASRGSNGNFVLSEFELEAAPANDPTKFAPIKLASAEADYSQKNYGIALAIDGKKDRSGWAVDGNTKPEDRLAQFMLAEPTAVADGAVLRVRMTHNYGASHQIGRFRLTLLTGANSPIPLAVQSILAHHEPGAASGAQAQTLRDFLVQRYGGPEIRAAAKEFEQAQLRRQLASTAVPATMVMAELAKPRVTHILERGEYDKPGEVVTAGVPAVFPSLPEGAPRNRLGLAQWLVARENPLTARVTVNRLWQQFFGIGLVKTTEDFGAQGEWPSHPDLLDYLAVEFIESGWDVKALLKQIVMSRTYRQSSALTAELLAHDPENRLLARGPRLRLDAETIRDSTLLTSGQLFEQLGGPSVFPYHPVGLWQEINNRPGFSRTYKQDTGAKLYRRSLYTFWKRTVPPPSMATFDAPSREYCVVRRSRTNTPLQAFVLLHDPQFVEASRHLAGRMLREGGADVEHQIRIGFQWATSRVPSTEEMAVLRSHYDRRLAQYRDDPAAAAKLLSVGASPRDESFDLATHAALTSVARLLLNLSEFITKG